MLRYTGHRHTVVAMLIGFVIGIDHGALGLVTGSFLAPTLVWSMGYSFLEASAKAETANLATNLGALPSSPRWRHRVAGGRRDGGGQRRRRLRRGPPAVSRGNRFVRLVFIVVVGAFIVRIGGDLLGWWWPMASPLPEAVDGIPALVRPPGWR